MNTKSPGRPNVPPGQIQPQAMGGNNFAPMTFGQSVVKGQGAQHFNNNSLGAENYNYSIPSDNLYPTMMHGGNFNSAQPTTNF